MRSATSSIHRASSTLKSAEMTARRTLDFSVLRSVNPDTKLESKMQDRNRKNVIELFVIRTGWFARFVGDQNIIDLFGTDTLPTAFTAAADAEVVLSAIQKLNPHHEVRRA